MLGSSMISWEIRGRGVPVSHVDLGVNLLSSTTLVHASATATRCGGFAEWPDADPVLYHMASGGEARLAGFLLVPLHRIRDEVPHLPD
jgi:hypothetical protein